MAAKKSEEVKKTEKADMPDFEGEDEEGFEEGADAGEDEEELEQKPGKAPPAARLQKKPVKAAPAKEEGPKLVKKNRGEAPITNKIPACRAFVLSKSGEKQKATEEAVAAAEAAGVNLEAGTPFLEYERGAYHRHIGYVNASGVLFPVGFRYKGGHVANQPAEYGIVLNHCPKCGHRQSVDEAVQGECQNMKVRDVDGDLGPCGYSAYEELDSYELTE